MLHEGQPGNADKLTGLKSGGVEEHTELGEATHQTLRSNSHIRVNMVACSITPKT